MCAGNWNTYFILTENPFCIIPNEKHHAEPQAPFKNKTPEKYFYKEKTKKTPKKKKKESNLSCDE